MTVAIWIVLCLAVLMVCAFQRCRLKTTVAGIGVLTVIWTVIATRSWPAALVIWLVYAILSTLVLHGKTRRRWLSAPALRWFRQSLPQLSASEHAALNAGTTGWETELFSGMPNWQRLERLPQFHLGEHEQAFMDGPLQSLLALMAAAVRNGRESDLLTTDSGIWQRLKNDGFLGLVIPTQFGGRGFSAYARSCILAQAGSAPGGTSLGPVMAAPNGLAPAQLLLASGTEAQKQRYLPALASGAEIPCFAITSTRAGTDAAAITDRGIICEYEVDNKKQIGIRLNWDKRHIMLAPVATLIGLAVHIEDPDQLLDRPTRGGMTCLLVPANTPGVDNSNRHMPVGACFPYGTTRGRNVFVPLDAIIGGPAMIGQGWSLLMEHLPVGRTLSMPSAAAGRCSASARLAGAYARVRNQFDRPIGAFEGVEEVLARMGSHAYACDAIRRLTAQTVDLGGRPAVAAAIAKYHTTSRAQQVAVDSMILHAGKAICAGPGNPIAEHYAAAPLAATSDGTNLFTRSMLILGRGGIRCHPYLQAEIQAAAKPDSERALMAFDAVFPAHVGHTLCTAVRALILGMTGGRGSVAGQTTRMRHYQQRINRYSAALSLAADLSMAQLGANLRHRETLAGRLGDILSQLYIASAVIQRYREEGAHQTDLNVVEWVCEDCFATVEQQLARVLRYLPHRPLAWLARTVIFPLGRHADGPRDDCNHRVATVLQTPGTTRERWTPHCHIDPDGEHGVALFDAALQAIIDTVALRKRLRRAIKRGDLPGPTPADCIEQAHANQLLDDAEADELRHAYALHDAVIRVDTVSTSNNQPTAAIST